MFFSPIFNELAVQNTKIKDFMYFHIFMTKLGSFESIGALGRWDLRFLSECCLLKRRLFAVFRLFA